MHGNVIAWRWDQYVPNFDAFITASATEPGVNFTKPYPHSARGGSWDDPVEKLRSAARVYSDKVWKVQDSQLPKSIWYHTDAKFLGLRLVRPLAVPAPDGLFKVWNNGVETE